MPERENNRLVKRIDAYGGDILRSLPISQYEKEISSTAPYLSTSIPSAWPAAA